jgi:hypothetical protein
MKKQLGSAVLGLLVSIILLAGVVGWVWNIVKIVGTFSDVLTGMFIARCIGVFVAPLGAVLGFL